MVTLFSMFSNGKLILCSWQSVILIINSDVVHLALKPMAFMAFDMFDIVFFIKLTLKFQYSNMTEK